MKLIFVYLLCIIDVKLIDDRKNWKSKFDTYHTLKEFEEIYDKVKNDVNSDLERVLLKIRLY